MIILGLIIFSAYLLITYAFLGKGIYEIMKLNINKIVTKEHFILDGEYYKFDNKKILGEKGYYIISKDDEEIFKSMNNATNVTSLFQMIPKIDSVDSLRIEEKNDKYTLYLLDKDLEKIDIMVVDKEYNFIYSSIDGIGEKYEKQDFIAVKN